MTEIGYYKIYLTPMKKESIGIRQVTIEVVADNEDEAVRIIERSLVAFLDQDLIIKKEKLLTGNQFDPTKLQEINK